MTDTELGGMDSARRSMSQVTDEMVQTFELAYLETIYPDRHDFASSGPGNTHFEGYRAGIRAVLSSLSKDEAEMERQLDVAAAIFRAASDGWNCRQQMQRWLERHASRQSGANRATIEPKETDHGDEEAEG